MEHFAWLREFIVNYPSLQFAVIFFGAAAGGEIALVTLAFLAAQKILPLPALIIFSALGTFFADSVWFILGRTAPVRKIISHRYATPTMEVITEALRRFSHGNNFVMLIMAKFLVGTRIVTLFFISTIYDKYRKFAEHNVVAIIIWLAVVIPVGYLSGLGFTYIAGVLQNIYAGLGFILLVILVIIVLQIWLKKILIQTPDE